MIRTKQSHRHAGSAGQQLDTQRTLRCAHHELERSVPLVEGRGHAHVHACLECGAGHERPTCGATVDSAA
eukprot:scaffold51313_cov59-Phaeocystis_antarctica.AAC.3